MKVNIKYLILACCLSAMTFSGCGKYEDGPTISFRSTDKRIIKLWKFSLRTINGADVTGNYLNDSVYIRNYGLYTYYSIQNSDATGIWSYVNHRRSINILSSGSVELDSGGLTVDKYYSSNFTATIKKLKNNELWLEGDEKIHDSLFYAGTHTIKDATQSVSWHLVPVK